MKESALVDGGRGRACREPFALWLAFRGVPKIKFKRISIRLPSATGGKRGKEQK